MKKCFFVVILSLFMFVLCSCGEKKVESDSHFGYNLEYIKDNFSKESYDLVIENKQALRFSCGGTSVTFALQIDSTYIDSICILSNDKDDAADLLAYINDFMHLYSKECQGPGFLLNANELGSLEEENIKFGYIPDFTENEFMFEIIKYKFD